MDNPGFLSRVEGLLLDAVRLAASRWPCRRVSAEVSVDCHVTFVAVAVVGWDYGPSVTGFLSGS
jgi:hypothetical protein